MAKDRRELRERYGIPDVSASGERKADPAELDAMLAEYRARKKTGAVEPVPLVRFVEQATGIPIPAPEPAKQEQAPAPRQEKKKPAPATRGAETAEPAEESRTPAEAAPGASGDTLEFVPPGEEHSHRAVATMERPAEKPPEDPKPRAKIAEVREYVQTSFEGTPELPKKSKAFRVAIPEPEPEEKPHEEIEELTFDSYLNFPDEPQEPPTRGLFRKMLSEFDDIEQEDDDEPLFERRRREPRPRRSISYKYDEDIDREAVIRELSHKLRRMAGFRAVALLLLLPLLWLGVSQTRAFCYVPQAISLAENPWLFTLINAILYGLFLAVTAGGFAEPLRELAHGRPGFELGVLLAAAAALCQIAVGLFDPQPERLLYCAVPALSVYCYYHTRVQYLKKVRTDYKIATMPGNKTVATTVGDEQLKQKLCDSPDETIGIALRQRQSVLKNVFAKSFARTPVGVLGAAAGILCAVAAVLIGLYCGIGTGDVQGMLVCLAGGLCLIAPVNGAFALRAPFAAVSERIKSSGAAIIGYDTIESFSRLDEMILNDNDLFPPESVVLTGTKMYGSARIDEVIVSAASIFRALDGPLSSVMLSIIDGREELLRPVTEIKYQDERGILAFIEGAVVLVGNREFMAYNKVPVPNDNLDRRVLDSGKSPVYVAINGKLAALLSLHYQVSPIMRRYLRKFVSGGVNLLVKTNDPVVTAEFVAQKFGLAADCVRLIPSRFNAEIVEEERKAVERSDISIVTITRDYATFLRTASGCLRLKNALAITGLCCLLSIVMGVVLVGFIAFTGRFELFDPAILLFFGVLWSLPALLVSRITKWLS
ncbi:hypothetical protein [Feifania hominis]|uniref:Uncharacterized protein n=1 Tax=Feifania hominis TaxID=2763660 RepID=A0A926DF27_9FIRM|nr:hypothetical protein [Feifania hominis]MBC8536968.1 hypothetical protein [Feifania hominis]